MKQLVFVALFAGVALGQQTIGLPYQPPVRLFPGGIAAEHTSWGGIFNVKDPMFGAKGDNVNDDSPAIQSAIDYAAQYGNGDFGAIVYFPSGNYRISVPIIIPRSTPLSGGHKSVALLGSGPEVTTLRVTTTFPVNRGMIELENVERISEYVSIMDFRFVTPNNIAGVSAIHFYPFDASTSAHILASQVAYARLERLFFLTNNAASVNTVWLEGAVRFSTLRDLHCDPNIVANNFDTNCIRFSTALPAGDPIGADTAGFNFGEIIRVQTGGSRGGRAQGFVGRLLQTNVQQFTCTPGVYHANTPCMSLENAYGNTFDHVEFENQGDQPPLRLTDSEGNLFTNISIGQAAEVPGSGSGTGNGLELVNSSRNTFIQRSWPLAVLYSAAGGKKLITLDATSNDNTFLAWSYAGTIASEISDLGTNNYGHFKDRVDESDDYMGCSPTSGVIRGATAPFTCDVNHFGTYCDTTLSTRCTCNSGGGAWCRDDTGVCSAAGDKATNCG